RWRPAPSRRTGPCRRRTPPPGTARRTGRRTPRRGDRAPQPRDPADPRRGRRRRDPRRPRHVPGVGLLRHHGRARLRPPDRLGADGRGPTRRAGHPRLPRHRGSGVSGLEITNLSVQRGGRLVLRDLSLEIPLGTVTTLLGPNGSGKSTLVLTVAGVLRPTSGHV